MRTLLVVSLDPVGDHNAGFDQAAELLAVEELVAEGAVEALDERVLLRAAFLDECGLHALAGEPVPEAGGDELAAVVGADRLRFAVTLEQLLELGADVTGADRAGDPA